MGSTLGMTLNTDNSIIGAGQKHFIEKLCKRYNKCIAVHNDYVEK